jgi:Holliday junction resolvase RusA-like endonuclease
MAKQEKKEEVQGPTPAEMRRASHEARNGKQIAIEDSREEFRKYFVELKRKLKLAPEIENVIWLHLKAVNMATKDKFNEGVTHFGYKI